MSMNKKYKKSQAALEFLTTYAWAFLVIIIMIATLAYFGVLKPSRILPDRCTFGAEIACVDHKIGSDGTFNLRLKNSVGEPIFLDAIAISTESTTVFSCSTNPAVGFTWTSGELRDFAWSGCNAAAVGFVRGDKSKVIVSVKHHLAKSSITYQREVVGEVSATVT